MTKYLKTLLFALVLLAAPMTWSCDADDDWSGDTPGNLSDKESSTQKIYGDYTQSDKMKGLTANIGDIAYVDQNKSRGQSSDGGSGSKSASASSSNQGEKYLNNVDSVTENRNKLRLNAASRAIALGQHAVSLATVSGDDVDALREEIESQDDVLRMMKGIAKLQAQHLQKTNAITAMRARLAELQAIENILDGSVYTTKTSSSSASSSSASN